MYVFLSGLHSQITFRGHLEWPRRNIEAKKEGNFRQVCCLYSSYFPAKPAKRAYFVCPEVKHVTASMWASLECLLPHRSDNNQNALVLEKCSTSPESEFHFKTLFGSPILAEYFNNITKVMFPFLLDICLSAWECNDIVDETKTNWEDTKKLLSHIILQRTKKNRTRHNYLIHVAVRDRTPL